MGVENENEENYHFFLRKGELKFAVFV